MPKEHTSRRRLGLATAGAVAASALAAALALGANFGLFGFAGPTHRTATFSSLTGSEPVEEQPTVTPAVPEVETRIVDVPVPLPAPGASAEVDDEDETAATVPSVVDRSEEHAVPSDDAAPAVEETESEHEDEPEVHDIEDHEEGVEDHADDHGVDD